MRTYLWLLMSLTLSMMEHYCKSITLNTIGREGSHGLQPNVKKSELPEMNQIKFMKTLLGKVKTLIHKENDLESKERNSAREEKVSDQQTPIEISAETSESKKIYDTLNDLKSKDKSSNVISVPIEVSKKIAKSTDLGVQGINNGHMDDTPKETRVLLKPISLQLGKNSEDNKAMTSMVPLFLPKQVIRFKSIYSDRFNNNPNGPKIPLIIRQHGSNMEQGEDDERLYKNDEWSTEDDRDDRQFYNDEDGLYRDTDDMSEEIKFHHKIPTDDRYHHPIKYNPDRVDDYDDDDDDNYDDIEDDDLNDDRADYKNSARMSEEERQIAKTRKRLYDMLPGNDPTYTSDNRELGYPTHPIGWTSMSETFLDNPRYVQQRAMLPFLGNALAGEHADNSNYRNVFMIDRGLGARQVYGNPEFNSRYSSFEPSMMRINTAGFAVGGSNAQALSPNEARFMLQNSGIDRWSQKNKIFRPKNAGVLLKVNGQPIGDSLKFRDRIVNGVAVKGKEKVIKSRGPMDVKITKATDGVHAKIVDITSRDDVKVLETKSKVAKAN
ncbi:uncharacterized protein LOC124452630 [Xenia sp. Carnegie-2017]|uniref:uncharacterized protein LOC124452630 n=1 Tax=Xenia sp. Carnegie-2017 TaxID=2897299 RepID=UPI001F0371DC|nr:uncharacterized protein LOC124452630 [Xenia sp. Carnegie-2017]